MASSSGVHDSSPVLVGVGRYTFHRNNRSQEVLRFGVSPLEMLLQAAKRAAADAGQDSEGIELNSIMMVSAATDPQVIAAARKASPSKLGDDRLLYSNPPAAVAASLGCPIRKVKELLITGDSGSMPQALVNRAFEEIAQGKIQSVLILGAEALHSFESGQKQGVDANDFRARWGDVELPGELQLRVEELQQNVGLSIYPFGKTLDEANHFFTELWRKHGLGAPVATYPLLENAIRLETGRTIQEQATKAAELFSEMSHVAKANAEHAWFGNAYTTAEIATESKENRIISHPFYLKRLNAVMAVDMSAALLIMSAREARRRKVPQEKWIFLHGCGEANDFLEVLERPSFSASPAIRLAGGRALRMAGVQDVNRDIHHMDIYSCFPSAVQIACKELGINTSQKPLTLTGGLPYHGGPGSNYVTHAIVAMAEKLRASLSQARGLITANGGYLTKHSFGIYANFPDQQAVEGTWRREDPAVCQAEVDAERHEPIESAPEGTGVVENYCVRYGRRGPELGVVIGRLIDGPSAGCRFVANTPSGDLEMLKQFVADDPIGAVGSVTTTQQGKGVFRLRAPSAKL